MPRNVKRDAEREAERRLSLIQAGFNLFSEKGIENVSLKEVADQAKVGVATLYNYYQNKTKLVVAISAHMWESIWKQKYSDTNLGEFNNLNAYQRVEVYLDTIIDIYVNHPDILRFSSDYKTFIHRQNVDRVDVADHLASLTPVYNMFHISYEKAKEDKSIRTDIQEDELFTTITLTMLGMAERYAMGLVWAMNDSNNYVNELVYTKQMILNWLKTD